MSPNAQVIFVYIKKGRSDGFSSHPENSFCDTSINIHASVSQKSKAGGCEEESLFGLWKNCDSGNTNLGNPESVLKKRWEATGLLKVAWWQLWLALTQVGKYLSLRTPKLFQGKSPVSFLSFWKVFWVTKDFNVHKPYFLTGLLAPWQRVLGNTDTILIFPTTHCTTEVWSKELRGKKNLSGDLSSVPVADSLLPMQGAPVRILVRELDPKCHN